MTQQAGTIVNKYRRIYIITDRVDVKPDKFTFEEKAGSK